MRENSLRQVEAIGQSIWLDYIKRDLLTSGQLRRLIEEDGLSGMTSNPAIFDKAIAESHDYDADIRAMALGGRNANAIYEELTQHDVQMAADEFSHIYEKTDGRDGYVSLEVNPHLAHDMQGTIEEARRLWSALKRPNILIKVPATLEGLSAIRHLIIEGINVNVTLLFGLARYRQVAEAYISGIEARLSKGGSVKHVASVASFFLSRIDALIDPELGKIIAEGGYKAALASKVRGQVAVASAKMAYLIHKELFEGKRFKSLAENGAHAQRLLWASTGNKNPDYSDVKYVEALIGPDTVSTIPVKTLAAFRDHGIPQSRLDLDLGSAAGVLDNLLELGISIDAITMQLEDEGVEKFNKPFDNLIEKFTEAKAAIKAEPGKMKV